MIQEFAYFSR